MTILPLEQIGFGPRSHLSALWWLWMLYRRPGQLEERWEPMRRWSVVRNGATLSVHAVLWMLLLCVLVRFFLFGVMGVEAEVEFSELHTFLLWNFAISAFGVSFGIALGSAFGIAFGILGGFARGVDEGLSFGILIGIGFGIGFGVANGIAVAIAIGITSTRGYYQFIAWPLSWPWPIGRWYRLHPVAWDDLCTASFPGFARLLLAYERVDSTVARQEIDRLISDYPSQRPAALRALTTLIARDAGKLTDLAKLLDVLSALSEGDRGYLRQTPRVREVAADISHAQQRLNEITRPLFREREAQNLRTEILNFRNNVAGMREPLASEFRKAADRWLEVAERQLSEITALVSREPTPAVFRAGEPVDSEQEAFIARVNIAAEIERLASQPAGARCVLLYGRRRMGKSVVLRNLRVILPANSSVATISMEAAQAFASLEDLLKLLSREITDNVGRTILSVPTDDGQDCPSYVVPRTLVEFEQLLDATNSCLASEGRKLIIAIDEYEYLDAKLAEGVLPVELLATLRSSIQTHPQLLWMFAGSHDITELSQSDWTSYLIGQRHFNELALEIIGF